MPAKSKDNGKAKKDVASFEKFKAVFFEEFLWSGDKTVKVDEAKLAKLFERCFKSKDYPTLDELRETVSFIATFTVKGVNYDHSVHYPKDFDEVSDFFEENLEGSFKGGLDVCRNQSRSSKSAHFAKAQAKAKPLPADSEKLVLHSREIQKRIYQLENEQREFGQQRDQVLAPFPRLKVVLEDERTREPSEKPVEGAEKVKMYFPRSHRVETVWKLPTQAMTENEKSAQKTARKLFLDDIIRDLEIESAEQRLRSIEKRAEKIGEDKERLRSIEEAVMDGKKSTKGKGKPSEIEIPENWKERQTVPRKEAAAILHKDVRTIYNYVRNRWLEEAKNGQITVKSLIAFSKNNKDS